jgi:predicted RNase H-like HicB family nuclease
MPKGCTQHRVAQLLSAKPVIRSEDYSLIHPFDTRIVSQKHCGCQNFRYHQVITSGYFSIVNPAHLCDRFEPLWIWGKLQSPQHMKRNKIAAKLHEITMEKIINIHIEKLPEGVYLATSEDIQGLVAQGRTATEALEIARDVARKLIEAQALRSGGINLATIADSFDYPLIVNA